MALLRPRATFPSTFCYRFYFIRGGDGKRKKEKKNDRCRDFVRFEIERSQFVTEREINR